MLARRDLVGQEELELGGDRLELNGILLVDDEVRHRHGGFRIPGLAQGLKGLQAHAGIFAGQILNRLIELDLSRRSRRNGQPDGKSRAHDEAASARV